MCYLDIYPDPKPSVLGKSVSALLQMGLLGFRVSLCLLILGERGECEHCWEDRVEITYCGGAYGMSVSPVEIREN